MQSHNNSRRRFLKSSALAGGGLLLGFSLPGCSALNSGQAGLDTDEAHNVSAWLSIATNGLITIRVPSSEMGQGVLTALPMIIAEELDADWSQVRSETAPVNADFIHPVRGVRGTGGSSAVRNWWPVIAQAGAAARQMLLQAAAQAWSVELSQLSAANSVVTHAASGRSASYGELAAAAGVFTPPNNPKLKNRDRYQIIGTSAQRLDTPAKVNGTAEFGIDVKVPNMVYATTCASPNFVGSLQSMDVEAAKNVNGVLDVIRLSLTEPAIAKAQPLVALADTVAVVASSYWQAKQGLQALRPSFDDGGVADVSSMSLHRDFSAALNFDGVQMRDDGDTTGALQEA
ncbi:MAG: hypothetical protein COC19_03320, partial [SAR86 cluster bacterium]